jgi:predicted 3-demethylubiquinone-9 3-methyltransferase (glyoxalase superfamily)
MPLILLKIARRLWPDARAENAAKYDVGIVGSSRIRAVARYGKSGFEVSWQIDPAGAGVEAAQPDRVMTTRRHLSDLERAAHGDVT